MKRILIPLLFLGVTVAAAFLFFEKAFVPSPETAIAPDPMELISQDACVWGVTYKGDLDKGCPRYYSGKCKDITAKFSTEKVGGKDVLVVDWEWHVPNFGKDSLKVQGKTHFVVDRHHGEWNLYVYKLEAGCRGNCEFFNLVGDVKSMHLMSSGRFFSDFVAPWGEMDIGIENAVGFTQYECGDPRCELNRWTFLSLYGNQEGLDSLERFASSVPGLKKLENKDDWVAYDWVEDFYEFMIPLARVDCKENEWTRHWWSSFKEFRF